ncbi:Digeranylgeranylglyceryl phosphate synthase [Actinidia chinensis var. chinensis]|uniref:Digeranylgeranylglyceryl phosphate synthase n=1 Tax=Actinidia chinensis var. chinensis TaxID=1590841 RepID=A0A2R6RN39_ACTCC|nr:Digeranylgeranylglyceryl phosphate synthase [Actinidia chinensis var. chinensis]
MLLLELGIESCIRHKLLATSGYHTLYEWYRSVESEHFPDPTGLWARIEQWTFGLYPACIKYLMSAFDAPEVMAITRNNICKKGMESLSRGGAVIYYASVFLYFWVFSTPIVSLVFGSYLYICINWLHLHFDEAFSSLRIANTSCSLASVSSTMVILRFSSLELTRFRRSGS